MLNEIVYIPSLLVISGNKKNIGKTWLACKIIEKFSEFHPVIAMKISQHFHNNMHEFQKLGNNFYLDEEKKQKTGKDSSKMLDAGAAHSFYIESSDVGLANNIEKINEIIRNRPCICESGGIINYVKPSLFLYIDTPGGNKNMEIRNKADIILDNHDGKVYFDLSNLNYKKGSWIYRG